MGIQLIIRKLENFLTRWYTFQLVKGLILFLAIGASYFIALVAVEYFFWLSEFGRKILFYVFLIGELFLLYRYILIPVLKLFRIKRGLSYEESSKIIGERFPDVGDRLLNLLQLAASPQKTELLLASIDQRSQQIGKVPFVRAISWKYSINKVYYMLIPLGIVIALWISGTSSEFFGSYQRVSAYNLEFNPPAPFSFVLMNDSLRVLEDDMYTIRLSTPGNYQPEEVFIRLEGTERLMERDGSVFRYELTPPQTTIDFSFYAAEQESKTYTLEALRVPTIDQFSLDLNFPAYLGRDNESIKGTGNAVIPEGTVVIWNLTGIHTTKMAYSDSDTVLLSYPDKNTFKFSKRFFKTTEYKISSSNAQISDYNELNYKLQIIKDQNPKIEVQFWNDSTDLNLVYFKGQVSDDYGLSKLELIVKEAGDDAETNIPLLDLNSDFKEFYYTFPSGLELDPQRDYQLAFKVTDNDGMRGGKSTRSAWFMMDIKDSVEIRQLQLNQSKNSIQAIENAESQRNKLTEELNELNKQSKEKAEFSFQDKEQIRNFLKKQEEQDQLMQRFSKELQEEIERSSPEPKDELLAEQLKRKELEAKKNEKLLKELQDVLDKIDKEELAKQLEEIGKNQRKNKRDLEQLVQLTKNYYVTEKASQLSQELDKLSKRQEVLERLNTHEQKFQMDGQEEISKKFEQIQEELDVLEKENYNLKNPLDWDRNTEKEASVKRDMNDAYKKLNDTGEDKEATDNQGPSDSDTGPQKSQRSAARKLKELSEELQQSAMSGSGDSMAEDSEMLRQILDNLVTFSFKQESLFDIVQNYEENEVNRSADIREQQELRGLFEHVDDSLLALSLRQVEISEVVNKQISEVYYNTDKALESLAENQWYRAASYQQYVITASNELAAFLANVLDNMQSSMKPGKGQGQGQDFQLQDIIQQQESLQSGMGKQKSEEGGNSQQGQEKSSEDGGQQSGEKGNKKEGNNNGGENGEGKEGLSNEQTSKPNGNSSGGSEGQSTQEMSMGEIYEIYKQQQLIRLQLEKQLQDMIKQEDQELARRISQQMENFENELLEKGITERTASRLQRIQHELMKLKNASMEQGENEERKSEQPELEFTNPIITQPEIFYRNVNEDEILNKQVLPLQPKIRNKVSRYFNEEY